MTTNNEKNIATFLHLSALTQYIIPFGNYIFPIIIWSSKKNDSQFVEANGKNVLNFLQLIIDQESSIELNFEDDIVKGTCVTHNGEIVNERVKQFAKAV